VNEEWQMLIRLEHNGSEWLVAVWDEGECLASIPLAFFLSEAVDNLEVLAEGDLHTAVNQLLGELDTASNEIEDQFGTPCTDWMN
jgi:hypothetical protein